MTEIRRSAMDLESGETQRSTNDASLLVDGIDTSKPPDAASVPSREAAEGGYEGDTRGGAKLIVQETSKDVHTMASNNGLQRGLRGLRRTAEEWQVKMDARNIQSIEVPMTRAGVQSDLSRPTMNSLRGLAKNREEAMDAAPSNGGRSTVVKSSLSRAAMHPLRGLAKNREAAFDAAPSHGGRNTRVKSSLSRAAMHPLRGLAKNREEAMDAAPSHGAREYCPPQSASQHNLEVPPLENSQENSEDDLQSFVEPPCGVSSPGTCQSHTSSNTENGVLNPEEFGQAEEDGLPIAIAVDEEWSDVCNMELEIYDPGAKPPFYKSLQFLCFAALILFVTTAAIVIAAVLSAYQKHEESFSVQAHSESPSMAPTSMRDVAVRDKLAQSVGDIVTEPGGPHEQALDWILNVDPMQLDETSANLVQRYTLALFYYQTSEQGPWISCNPASEGENYTCPYYDKIRSYQPQSLQAATLNDTLVLVERDGTEVRWLSKKHECEWANVLCHPETDGNVIALDILRQDLSGTLPEELRLLDDLMWLSLSYNLFTGKIPEAYGEFPYLTIFEVTDTLLTGQIPEGFFRQSNLLQINAQLTLLTGTIPPEIGDLTTLHSLFFYGTAITGSLPTEIGLLEDVRNLWLQNNNGLTGPIPSEIGQLSLLEDLVLSNNGHSGTLPSEMGLLTNMKQFLFAGQDMGGSTIPEEFWNISSIINIDLNRAGLGGSISTNIGKMTTLQGLKASRNFFTGTVPSEIGLLDDLILLWVHANPDLGGSVPIEICQLRGPDYLRYLNSDCAGNPPRMECLTGCCTGCCDDFEQCRKA